ncbi:insulinase family peptidase (macronuclear) [Tetrahymena thermophila SB210]|uniref:Insulinase family peptidase n=1 Tax=Tetrahymena thermophila (strain SB210) TaxID=312017 RepID=I7MFE5_TETTS|nr:insulinase family peptidase [Tetrahymena thermophila SB210]EAR99695.2 insulinase family peptidase [Tetrahymena thermophila SB210]|eukprot:XP_001019940.2 insulinase family peptidase [Tetrahymena thermophila SB210]
MEYIKKLFSINKKSEILMDEEEQQIFFNQKQSKNNQKSIFDDDVYPVASKHSKKRTQENYFDRDQLSMKEIKEFLARFYERNKLDLEKCFIFVVILALAIVLIGICLVLVQTFDQENIERKTYLLDNDVIKPINDMKNNYKLITLANQLQILIIWNNQTQFSSVSLDINAGSWQESQKTPGLAHLLEHMTFLQSQKYKEQYYFDNFLSVNGGYTDSFTSFDHTNFFFTIKTYALQKALDIFAHMFIDPVYDLELAKKESSVVESEFKISLQDDNQKIRHLLTIMSDPSHPYSRFTAGNVQTLRDNFEVNIVEELESFRSSYYSSNLMKLVIFTEESIENVEEYIKPFQEIVNNLTDEPNFKEFKKPLKNTKKIVKLKTLDENEVLYTVFQIDLDKSQFQKRPIEFITYFLNNNMDGGLKYYLNQQLDLILDLEVGNILEQENYTIFYIKFIVQNKKLNKFQTIVNALVNYLEFIKEKGLEISIYQERALISNMTFSYNGHSYMTQENVSNYAWNLNEYDYREVFAADSLWSDDFDKNLMKKVINQMQDFDNIILIAGSSNFSNQNLDDIVLEDQEELSDIEGKDQASYKYNFIELSANSQLAENESGEDVNQFQDQPKSEVQIPNEFQFLNTDEFDNSVPLYDIQYSEKTLIQEDIEYMKALNETLLQTFQVQQKNQYIPSNFALEDICYKNQMNLNYTYIDLSQHVLPDPNSNVCLYSPYENPTRKFTNFNFTEFYFESYMTCDSATYIQQSQKYPSLIKYENGIEGWYKLDLQYGVPQIVGYFNIQFQDRFESPRDVIKGKIIANIFQQKVQEFFSEALESGYLIEVTSQYSSLNIKIVGWSQNFDRVVFDVFRIWKYIDITPEDYQNSVEEIKEQINNYQQWDTTTQGKDYFLKKVMLEEFIDPKMQLQVLQKISYQDVLKHSEIERNKLKLIGLLAGNIQSSYAQNLYNELDLNIQFNKELQEYRNVYGVFDIDSLYLIKVKTASFQQDVSRSLVAFYQIGKRNSITITEGRIVMKLFKQYIQNYLINEKQKIYKINTELISYGSYDGILITVQAEDSTIIQMQNDLQDTIIQFQQNLPLFLDDSFENILQTELGAINSMPLSLVYNVEYFWKQLTDFNYVFDEQNILAQQIQNTTKQDIISAFESIFVKDPKAVIVQVHNYYDSLKKTSSSIKQKNQKENIVVITDIYKQMKNRNFNKFVGEFI